jgi:hypothetical protein
VRTADCSDSSVDAATEGFQMGSIDILDDFAGAGKRGLTDGDGLDE